MRPIAPHVYVRDSYRLVTVGCIVSHAGVICIDTPAFPADARDWRTQIARITDKPVRFVVLTDGNRDRIQGAQELGGTVIAHELTWEKIKSYGDSARQPPAPDVLPPCGGEAVPDWRPILPQITFARKLVLYQGDVQVIIEHVGGVTPGSVWVHLPRQNVLFAGDLATPGHHPLAAEANLPVWLDVLKRIQDKHLAVKHIVPGRGAPCNKAALEQTADYLGEMRARVQALVRSRKPRTETAALAAEFLARYPVADADRDCIQRRIKAGLEHLYDSLKAKK